MIHRHTTPPGDNNKVSRLKEQRMRELDRYYSRHSRQLKQLLEVLKRSKHNRDKQPPAS